MIKKDGLPSPTKLHTFDQHWPNIQLVVKQLIESSPISKQEWQDLFYHVHMVCSWDDKGCYKLLRALDQEFLDTLISGIKTRLLDIEDGHLQLKEYVTYWRKFCHHCTWFPVAFQQLDLATKTLLNPTGSLLPDPTSISKQSAHKKKLNESTVRYLMLKLWHNHIISPLNKRLIDNAIQVLFHERNSSMVDNLYIIGLCKSFKTVSWLHDYTKTLETKYVQELEIFYSSRADEVLIQKGIIGYIIWATDNINEEKKRAQLYLGAESPAMKRVDEACTRVLVARYVEPAILESSHFIRDNDAENLRLIFEFIDRIQDNKVNLLMSEFENHLVTTGMSHMTSSVILHSNCEKFTEKLIEIYRQFSIIIKRAFGDDSRAKLILERSFSTVVNDASSSAGNSAAQLLASYSDLLLRRSNISRRCNEDELSAHLSEVLFVVRFLKNKEAFVKYHKLHLSRRLILGVSIDGEREERFVGKLKDIAGIPIECINKMSRMFKDLKASEEFERQFRKAVEPSSSIANNNNNISNNNNINFMQTTIEDQPSGDAPESTGKQASLSVGDAISIRVLNPVAWTTTTTASQLEDIGAINLPSEISSLLPSIRAFYQSQQSGRKLDWQHQLSTALVTFSNSAGARFELEVSAGQLCVLMAFNEAPDEAKTLAELELLTRLSAVELRRTLWSLVSNQKLREQQLVLCAPKSSQPADLERPANEFRVNREFVLFKNGYPQSRGRLSLIGRLQI